MIPLEKVKIIKSCEILNLEKPKNSLESVVAYSSTSVKQDLIRV